MLNKKFTAFDEFLKILDQKDREGIEIPDFIFEKAIELKYKELSNIIQAYDFGINNSLLGVGPDDGKEYIINNYSNYTNPDSVSYGHEDFY